ncbi:FAD-dependent oxidoreductase [Streptomyces sp. NPDC049555]|uniref:NAD(P)/FAD-dependent oxidoreductase n=1 Tax=Streptomyces sp. NPDC049555 TaxID=3154930 RepID=UPI003446D412
MKTNSHAASSSSSSPAPRVVVLGGGYAGLVAALRLAPAARVTLVDPGDGFTERVRLHQLAAGRARVTHPYSGLLRGTGIEHVAARAADLDLQARSVRTDDGRTLSYDRLVYALGSVTDTAGVEGVEGAQETGHARIHTAESAGALHQRLIGAPGRVSVVGGGLTGIELAAEIAEAHPAWEVRLLTSGVVGAGLSARGRAHVYEVFRELGVRVEEGRRVASAGEVDADAVVWAAAMRPVTGLAARSGLALDAAGRIAIDGTARSVTDPAVYAAGDAAGTGIRMACAVSLPMGLYVAASVRADLEDRRSQLRPFHYGFVGQCISLGRRDGLLQMVRSDDSPRSAVLTGRPAAFVKERVVRGTVFALRAAAAGARRGGLGAAPGAGVSGAAPAAAVGR